MMESSEIHIDNDNQYIYTMNNSMYIKNKE
jgi:hypothetical protein